MVSDKHSKLDDRLLGFLILTFGGIGLAATNLLVALYDMTLFGMFIKVVSMLATIILLGVSDSVVQHYNQQQARKDLGLA